MGTKDPLVTVFCPTYNHEKFIRQCLDGFVMQQTNFEVEVIVHDDASTDKTPEIILEYQFKHSGLIKPILQKENQLSKDSLFLTRTMASVSRGKYIALCEGDDYWTDPYKLQKQVDFLDANPDYSVTFHRYKILDHETKYYREDGCGFLFDNFPSKGIEVDTNLFLNHWITQPVTMVFRKNCFDISITKNYHYFRDIHLIYHVLQNGKGYLFEFNGAVYREHMGGLHSKQSLKYQSEIGVVVAKELYLSNKKDKELKDNYLRTLEWGISCFSGNHYGKLRLINFIVEHLYYSGSLKRFIKNSYSFFKNL